MSELTWLLDSTTGGLVVEGMTVAEASALADDLLPSPREITCTRPLTSPPLPAALTTSGSSLRIARIYHGSLIEGPGRRSVVQRQGCPIRCPGCVVPETHEPVGGAELSVADVMAALLDPAGEPFYQPAGLLALLQALKMRGIHTVAYSGYTLEALRRRPEPEVGAALNLIDLLIDGPFIAALADGAGEWRGSRSQRVIPKPAANSPDQQTSGWGSGRRPQSRTQPPARHSSPHLGPPMLPFHSPRSSQ